MRETVKNRCEILFLYDVKWANPNGDPMDENKPRLDEQTDTLFVTDVRLKRTVRDYLEEKYGETLWVTSKEVLTPEKRMKDLGIQSKDDAVEKCIDVRLFGAVLPTKGKGATETSLTGPVQFRYGRSLHRVRWEYIQGTAAFVSREGAEQRSFREEYVIPYSLIAFYGIVNQNSAKYSGLTYNDVDKLMEGLWIGTKNLITRSKMEHNPRLLVRIDYKEGVNYHIGELDYLIELVSDKEDELIRDVTDFSIEIGELVSAVNRVREKIQSIEYRKDERLSLLLNGVPTDVEKSFTDLEVREMRWSD
ncbi:MAG: type I-B CRISPR-associated protein Cas7/Csh2 [Thermotoga sp.]|nr:MAG: type I-B CRISPR-associated protein Cas7/Csh2 [Thermotoga sp.]HDM70514.1 type I-B CRISPR-associated protein Cas7/Csh2 [Thermotogales bacterium]